MKTDAEDNKESELSEKSVLISRNDIAGKTDSDDGKRPHWLDSPILAVLFIVGCMALGLMLAFGIASTPDWLIHVNGNLPKVILGSDAGTDRNVAPEDDSELDANEESR